MRTFVEYIGPAFAWLPSPPRLPRPAACSQDLFKPDPARLKRNLCALINFAKFRDEKVAFYDELEAEMQAKVQAEEGLNQEYERNVRGAGCPVPDAGPARDARVGVQGLGGGPVPMTRTYVAHHHHSSAAAFGSSSHC